MQFVEIHGRGNKMKFRAKLYPAILVLVIIAATYLSATSYYGTMSYPQSSILSSFNGTASSAVFDSQNGLIYVSSFYANAVYVFNPSDSRIIKTINMPIGPEMGMLDPLSHYIYFPGLEQSYKNFTTIVTVINASSNVIVANISLGIFDPVQNVVFDNSSGLVYVLANSGLYSLNRTVLRNCNLTANVFPASQFAADPYSGTGFFIGSMYPTVYSVSNYSGNGTTVSQARSFGPEVPNNYFIEFIGQTNQLMVSAENALYCIDPSNLSHTFFSIKLPQKVNSGNGVSSLVYDASTKSIYVTTYGHHNIRVYNDSNGIMRGIISLGSAGSAQSYVSVGPNGTLLAIAGSSLLSVNPVLTEPQPDWTAFAVLTALSASAAAYSTYRYIIWKNRKIREPE